jgi:hypothetical protein
MSDKEARHRDKMEAHLYCSLKVATDEDIKQQVRQWAGEDGWSLSAGWVGG